MDKSPLLPHDFQVAEYINSFRHSSDRVRWMLYAVLIVSAVIATMTWHTRPGGWADQRLEQWRLLHTSLPPAAASPVAGEAMPPPATISEIARERRRKADEAEIRSQRALLDARSEYMRQLISRGMLVTVPPLLGASLDFNEIGPAAGAVLLVLMILLLFCLARQHENLYLCTFKIHRLCKEPDHHDGESAANFLYHALVMTQVLNHPDLARLADCPQDTRSAKATPAGSPPPTHRGGRAGLCRRHGRHIANAALAKDVGPRGKLRRPGKAAEGNGAPASQRGSPRRSRNAADRRAFGRIRDACRGNQGRREALDRKRAMAVQAEAH